MKISYSPESCRLGPCESSLPRSGCSKHVPRLRLVKLRGTTRSHFVDFVDVAFRSRAIWGYPNSWILDGFFPGRSNENGWFKGQLVPLVAQWNLWRFPRSRCDVWKDCSWHDDGEGPGSCRKCSEFLGWITFVVVWFYRIIWSKWFMNYMFNELYANHCLPWRDAVVLELVADLPMIFIPLVFPYDVFAAWWAACCTGALALQRISEAIASACWRGSSETDQHVSWRQIVGAQSLVLKIGWQNHGKKEGWFSIWCFSPHFWKKPAVFPWHFSWHVSIPSSHGPLAILGPLAGPSGTSSTAWSAEWRRCSSCSAPATSARWSSARPVVPWGDGVGVDGWM